MLDIQKNQWVILTFITMVGAWAIWNVEVDREDIFNINGTNRDIIEPAYDSYQQYYVTAKTGLFVGTYTGKIYKGLLGN